MENVQFTDLTAYIGKAVVMTALRVDDKVETMQQMNDCNLVGILKDGNEVTDILRIVENVKGEEGRQDVLLLLKNFDVNPIARLNMPDVKWVEDFVENFKRDYIADLDDGEEDE